MGWVKCGTGWEVSIFFLVTINNWMWDSILIYMTLKFRDIELSIFPEKRSNSHQESYLHGHAFDSGRSWLTHNIITSAILSFEKMLRGYWKPRIEFGHKSLQKWSTGSVLRKICWMLASCILPHLARNPQCLLRVKFICVLWAMCSKETFSKFVILGISYAGFPA